MSQQQPPPPPEPDKNKPAPRRSSILTQHAMKEGVQIPGNEFLRGISIARLSNGQQMGRSSGIQNSLNPTPLSSMPSHRGGYNSAYTGGSSIPRAVNSSVTKKFMQPTNSSVAKTKSISGSAPVRNVRGRGSQNSSGSNRGTSGAERSQSQRKIPIARPNATGKDRFGSSRNTTLYSMRRSTSMDSVAFGNSQSMMLTTPSMSSITPGLRSGRSPGSMKRWGSMQDVQRDNSHHAKTIKLTSDKKTLHSMMVFVHAFLLEERYPNLPPTPTEIKNISTSTYYHMVSFVGQFMVGPQFFLPKEDLPSRIIELSSVLKYPSVISKSHLKSANAQHAWPNSLTFLTWLVCRVRAIPKTEPRNNPMEDFMKASFPEIALQNYLNIFYFRFNSNQSDVEKHQQAMREKTEEELLAFQNKVSYIIMSEVNYSLEELHAQKEEQLEHLSNLQGKPDPVKVLSETLDEKTKKLQAIRNKVVEAQERIKTYRDINSLRVDAEGFKLEIASCQSEIEGVKERLASQPFNKQEEQKKLMEVSSLQRQRDCLASILSKLDKDLIRKQQAISRLNEDLRITIAQFTVVETFNEKLSYIRQDGLSVPINPLTPEDLKDWLNVVENIHNETEQLSQKLMEAIKSDNAKLEKLEMCATEERKVCLRQNDKTQALIDSLYSRNDETSAKYEMEIKSLESTNAELTDLLKERQEMIEHLKTKSKILGERLEKKQALFEKKTETLKRWWAYVEEAEDNMSYVESYHALQNQRSAHRAIHGLVNVVKRKNELLGPNYVPPTPTGPPAGITGPSTCSTGAAESSAGTVPHPKPSPDA